jgi:SAM-dependent methyltransferase
MNDLEKYFQNNQGNLINKWQHYFEIYDRHLSRYRNTDVHILEIGVRHGGSLQMWKHYFGPSAKVYGLDIHPRSRELEEPQIEIFVGDQEDRAFLATLRDQLPRIDILLDDGGHTMAQQINTFEELYHHIAADGVYICEDTHTSYWSTFGGGYRQAGTFIEYAKDLVDELHAFHKREENEAMEVTDFTQSVNSMHFYDSMVIFEKRPRNKPEMSHTGKMRLPRFKATSFPKASED